jgi:Cu(I)/Ag(I) efflux system membrane fusion protein
VVVSGQFLIDSEASLRGSAIRMADTPAAAEARAPEGPLYRAEGRVEQIDKQEITLSHGPIPALQWGAMTMDFKLPATGLPPGIAVGTMVAFEFRQANDGAYQIANMHLAPALPMKKADPAGAAK